MYYSFVPIHPSDEEIERFVRATIDWAKEREENVFEKELELVHKRSSYIDHCWIYCEFEIIGVVKINYDTFFSLGFKEELSAPEFSRFLDAIVREIQIWHPQKVRGTLHESYRNRAVKYGFDVLFTREKLVLDLSAAQHILPYDELNLHTLKWRHMNKIIELFSDAYRGGVDEKIGMFNEEIASSALEMIKNGRFGKVESSLSFFTEQKGKYTAGVITTYQEEMLFIVIIGVLREMQGQRLGTKLLSAVIDRGLQKGHKKLFLWVTNENTYARRLYYHLGFQKVNGVVAVAKSV